MKPYSIAKLPRSTAACQISGFASCSYKAESNLQNGSLAFGSYVRTPYWYPRSNG
jgi:hypothetical protein